MLKKLFIILFLLMIPTYSFSYEVDDEYFDINELEVSNNTSNIPNINSKHAIVIEKNTNTILFEKSSYTKTAMASTTKIMTAIIALENSNLSDLVKISKKAATTGGSTLGISSDTSLSMETLLYGLLLRSGNDLAVS